MAEISDLWYVRFPDGRVIRAKSTKWLRYHLSSGRIPADARVRRSPAEEWTTLEWTAEFVDIFPKGPALASTLPAHSLSSPNVATNKSKLEEIKVLGLRGLVEDLINALESTLQAVKLTPAGGLGVFLGLGAAIYVGLIVPIEPPWSWIGTIVLGVSLLLGFCLATALITQITFIELSRLRPARSREIRAGLARHTVQLWLAHFLVFGSLVVVFLTLEKLPSWLLSPEGPGWREAFVAPLIVLRQIAAVGFWPLWSLLLLLGPIAVIEECSYLRAIQEWWALSRRHAGRLMLYETMAILLGLLVSAPLLLPVLLTAWSETGLLGIVSQSTMAILGGLALTPCLAYLPVANVFIYLDVRYEFSQGNR
jgi:hypothetical protein